MSKIINKTNINKTIRYLKKNGLSSAYYAVRERIDLKKAPYNYEAPSDEEIEYEMNCKWSPFCADPGRNTPLKISILMPTYNTPKAYLQAAIDSVLNQTYPHWELVIADASDNEEIMATVEEYSKHLNPYSSIRYIKLSDNCGISGNSNKGLESASGDYIALMDHDDLLCPDALFSMQKSITETYNSTKLLPAIVYSDEDKTDSESLVYFDPHIKYDFNYDLLLTNNYICHLLLIRKDYFDIVRFREEYDGAQDFDLVLQIVRCLILKEKVRVADLSKHIVHVDKVLYHWRSHAQSTAENTDSKLYAYESGLNAIRNHFSELKINGIKVSHSKHLGFYDTEWDDIFKDRPEVGAVIGRIDTGKGKMAPCLLNEDGEWLYAGLNMHYAGELNHFDCAQNVYAADIRYMKYSEGTDRLLEEFLSSEGISKKEITDSLRTDTKSILKRDGKVVYLKDLSMKFGELMKKEGLLIVYMPRKL